MVSPNIEFKVTKRKNEISEKKNSPKNWLFRVKNLNRGKELKYLKLNRKLKLTLKDIFFNYYPPEFLPVICLFTWRSHDLLINFGSFVKPFNFPYNTAIIKKYSNLRFQGIKLLLLLLQLLSKDLVLVTRHKGHLPILILIKMWQLLPAVALLKQDPICSLKISWKYFWNARI